VQRSRAGADGASGGNARPSAQATPAAPARAFPAWEQLSAAEREMLVAPVRERWNSNPEARARMMDHASAGRP
jgi:acyl-CoA reductase-like NAD-dependent aldehyde dehydrogenase